ncbi:MAG: C45 family peptidase [Chloroflexota bacterium]|nr:C45 family peptidase [Chloroflexota bacterium]
MTTHRQTFPAYRFSGSHLAIGRAYGDACGDDIRRHRDLALERLRRRAKIAPERAVAGALAYRRFVVEHAPFLDEEIRGVAEGAGLSLAEAYFLQLRAEAAVVTPDENGDECTTFAVLPEATSNGVGLVGQNADLPAFYRAISVVVEFVPDDGPAVLMLTPAGQVSYIGINDRGLGVFANYLSCDGWRVGYPRYLLTRLAMTHETVDAALAAVRSVPRASSRNLIMLDAHGVAADLETTATRDARLEPDTGLLAHSNHYLAPELLAEEKGSEQGVANSRVRYQRMRALLEGHRGELDATLMQTLLRDRSDLHDSICRVAVDDPSTDIMTFASAIAEPTKGQMWVAIGPPSEHSYRRYAFAGSIETHQVGEVDSMLSR